MPNIIPPIVSSSPPPLDPVDDDNEDEDEFGDFATADIPINDDLVGPKNTYETSWKKHGSNPTNDKYPLHENGIPPRPSEITLESSVPVFNVSTFGEESQQATSASPDSANMIITVPESIISSVPSPMLEAQIVDGIKLPESWRSTPLKNVDDREIQDQNFIQDATPLQSMQENIHDVEIIPDSNVNIQSLNTDESYHVNASICSKVSADIKSSPKSNLLNSQDDLFQNPVAPSLEIVGESANLVSSCVSPCHDEHAQYNAQHEQSTYLHSSSKISARSSSPASANDDQEIMKKAEDSEEDESVRAMIVPEIPIGGDDCGDFYNFSVNGSNLEVDTDSMFAEFESLSRRPTLVLSDDLTELKDTQPYETPVSSHSNSHPDTDEIPNVEQEKIEYLCSDITKHHNSTEGSAINCGAESDFSEFADFTQAEASFSAEPSTKNLSEEWARESVSQAPSQGVESVEFDDFNDFESAEFQASEAGKDQASKNVPNFEFNSMRARLDSIFKELFPVGSGAGDIPEVEQCTSGNGVSGIVLDVEDSPIWQGLRDLETTPSLSFQWPGSHSNRGLLGSLNIDSRNILFGPKWNTVVPRFAANLGFSPLEPVRAIQTQPTESSTEPDRLRPQIEPVNRVALSSTGFQDTVPAAQFDWNDSGLVNPLDCVKDQNGAALATTFTSGNPALESPLQSPPSIASDVNTQDSKLSPEASRILESLPELAFLSARMLMFPVQSDSSAHKL